MDAHLHCKIPTPPFHCAASNSRFKLCVGKTAKQDEETTIQSSATDFHTLWKVERDKWHFGTKVI